MLLENTLGNYAFLQGIAPYSGGVTAADGFEIIHVRLSLHLPLSAGFDTVETYLRKVGRPPQALCGMELRSPKPFSFHGFSEFNASYVDILKKWNLLIDGVNPIARTNVAPAVDPPAEATLYGFSYTAPSHLKRKTFVVAGAGELPEGSLDPGDVVRSGDLSPAALQEKIRFVIGLMEGRLAGLGAAWRDVTVTEVYTVHNIHPFIETDLISCQEHGFVWHYSRPPIESIEYEMDLRGCATELIL